MQKNRMLNSSRMRCLLLIPALFSMASLADESADWAITRSQSRDVLLNTVEADSKATEQVRIRALLTLSDLAINRSVEQAEGYLERAQAVIKSGTDAELVGNAIRCQLDQRQALPIAQTTCARIIDLDLSSESGFVRAFVHATRMYYYYRDGQHKQSLEEAERALEFATMADDNALLAAAHNMIGLYFSTKLLPRMSLPHFESALEHAGRLPNTAAKTITQLNLASSYTYLGRGREALKMLEEARESPVVSLYANRRLVLQSMIGQARAAIGETDGAAQNLQRVIDEVSSTVLPDGMTFGYTGLGVIQLAENQPQAALASFNKVLSITGKNFETDLEYSRIQLMAVPYATALRESGQIDAARSLLDRVIATVPPEEPDQLLADAYQQLALTLEATGDAQGAKAAADNATRVESRLWDASFQYQVARLNAALEYDRRKFELERAGEREIALREVANREAKLRRQSWLIGALLIAFTALFFSRRLQKRIADAERAASTSLEHQVQERTQELEDEMGKRMAVEVEQRHTAQRMYEGEKMKAMGQLTAGVAHDFNNLMTVVTLGADQLKSQLMAADDPDTAETIEHIRSAADTGAKITRGLLAYVREQPLQPESLQLHEYLSEALPMFRNTLGERFTLEISLVTCRVVVDKGQLTTAILNLLLNAKEAMASGGKISVTLHNVKGQARIEVRDYGTGMSEHDLKHAFDPFFTTKDIGEGTGLGLSMVYGFARQSHGDLTIASELNKGTTVTLSLPLVFDFAAEKTAIEDQAQRISRGLQVLAVEDRIQLLNVLKRSLTGLGIHVACASSADEALEMVANTGLPDILITDIVMPGALDGLGLVARLREINPDLPVVLMSGYTKDVDEDCTFLHKPFSIDELEDAIANTLNQTELA
ncbi:MAG: ATP-binding protein [Gammaproteobacteria bacterium]